MTVDEQYEILTRGAVDLVTLDELKKKLARSEATGQPLVVKVGFDPTAPDIHLGHTVLLRKMRQFQDLGHRVIFVIGDFTGMIGDPTGRVKTRPALTREQILENAETYKRQCFKVLDPVKTEIRFNSEWLSALGAEGMILLAAKYNVARMLERKDFKERYTSGVQISMHEFLYPLAQAYDSVFLKADVELGGTDQLFNLNVGRDIMPGYGLAPQIVLTMPLLEGLDGVEKMSKSLNNYVGVEEAPASVFGKIMSINDDLMWRYYLLCTDVSPSGIEQMKRLVKDKTLHPKKAKQGLAMRIITDFHGEAAAKAAFEEFERVHERKEIPSDAPVLDVSRLRDVTVLANGILARALELSELLKSAKLVNSNSEALRKLGEGAIRLNGERLNRPYVSLDRLENATIQVGNRRFAKLSITSPPSEAGGSIPHFAGGIGFSPSNSDPDDVLSLIAACGQKTRLGRALAERPGPVSHALSGLIERAKRASGASVSDMTQIFGLQRPVLDDKVLESFLAALRGVVFVKASLGRSCRLLKYDDDLGMAEGSLFSRGVQIGAVFTHSPANQELTEEGLEEFVVEEVQRMRYWLHASSWQKVLIVIALNRVESFATMVHSDFERMLERAHSRLMGSDLVQLHIAVTTGMHAIGHEPDDAAYPPLEG